MSASITYKNDTLVSFDSGTKTLKTAGKYLEDDITVTVDGSGGGGGEPAPKKQINFIDYDGTILYSYTRSEWQNESTLPSNPSHNGLTAQGWNWTKAQIDTQLTAVPDGDVWVGQMYITDDGTTRIYIHLEQGRLHPYLGFSLDGTAVVDWGDNSATDTRVGYSNVLAHADHEYASEGDYTITITASYGSFAFTGVTNTSHILKKGTSTSTFSINQVYASAVRKIELGRNAQIDDYAFNYCYSLASVTIPSSVISIGTYAFQDCRSLASITIPSGVTSISSSAFQDCYSLSSIAIPSGVTSISQYAFNYCQSLSSIAIPSGVTSINQYAFQYCQSLASVAIPSGVTSIVGYSFQYCYSLSSVTIPSGVTSISNSAFRSCYSLSSITIPSSVTSISSYAFYNCYGIAEYHVLPITPPTLSNQNAFNNIQSDCKIYVPSASLETYKTASNWSNYASYMVGE